ncbi:MAG: hypothetical protein ACOYXN_12685 [Acidobacteriota bacterium]
MPSLLLFLFVLGTAAAAHVAWNPGWRRLLSWGAGSFATLAAYGLLGLFLGRSSRYDSARRKRSLAQAALIFALLQGFFFLLGAPSLLRSGRARSYQMALKRLEKSVGEGKVAPPSYARWRYGDYAPFLNFLHTMAFDYEKEVADFHAEEASIRPPEPAGLEGKLRQGYIVDIRKAVGDLRDCSVRHRAYILSRLELYSARLESLPYPPEVQGPLVREFETFRETVQDLTESYFENHIAAAAHIDDTMSLLQYNPEAYVLDPQFQPQSRVPRAYGVPAIDLLVSVRLKFSNPFLEAQFVERAAEAEKFVSREVFLQNAMNRYYYGEGQRSIRRMEEIVAHGLSR